MDSFCPFCIHSFTDVIPGKGEWLINWKIGGSNVPTFLSLQFFCLFREVNCCCGGGLQCFLRDYAPREVGAAGTGWVSLWVLGFRVSMPSRPTAPTTPPTWSLSLCKVEKRVFLSGNPQPFIRYNSFFFPTGIRQLMSIWAITRENI